MARRQLPAGSRNPEGQATLLVTIVIAEQWRALGTAHSLSDDSEIAAFLLSLYENSKQAVSLDIECCITCKQPLPRYHCSQCSQLSNSPSPSTAPTNQTTTIELQPADTQIEENVVTKEEMGGGSPPTKKQTGKTVEVGVVAAALEDGALDGFGQQVEIKVEVEEGGADGGVGGEGGGGDGREVSSEEEDSYVRMKCEESTDVNSDGEKSDPTFKVKDEEDAGSSDELRPDPKPRRCQKRRQKQNNKTDTGFKCNHCSATFQAAYRLKRHSRIHADGYGKDRLYSCEQCRMTFRLKGSLDAHMRMHSGQQPYQCAVCNLAFTRASQAKKHVQSHHGDQLSTTACFKCATCQAVFVLYKKFTTHVWRHTLERKFQCEHCPMAFFEQSSLRVHRRVHTGDKPFTCSECGLSFHQLCNLNRHILTHSGERPYRCTLCPATYPASQQLKRHLQSHRGEKSFLCQLCGASYTESKSLKFHMRSHTGEKPFKCDLCEKEFARPASLKVHKRTHSCDRPYVCALCGTSFADNSNLHRHHRLKHLGKSKKRQGGGKGGGGGEGGGSHADPESKPSIALQDVGFVTPEGSIVNPQKTKLELVRPGRVDSVVDCVVDSVTAMSNGGLSSVGVQPKSGAPISVEHAVVGMGGPVNAPHGLLVSSALISFPTAAQSVVPFPH